MRVTTCLTETALCDPPPLRGPCFSTSHSRGDIVALYGEYMDAALMDAALKGERTEAGE